MFCDFDRSDFQRVRVEGEQYRGEVKCRFTYMPCKIVLLSVEKLKKVNRVQGRLKWFFIAETKTWRCISIDLFNVLDFLNFQLKFLESIWK